MRKYLSIVALLFSVGLFAPAQTPSVADAAKDKSVKKARRVITNDDIPSKPDTTPGPAGAKTETTVPSAEAITETAKSDAEKSASPEESDAAKAAQKKVDDIKEHLNTIQQQIAETDKKIDSATDDQVRDALVSARDGKKEFAAELTKQLAAAEKELEAAKGTSEKPAEPAKDRGIETTFRIEKAEHPLRLSSSKIHQCQRVVKFVCNDDCPNALGYELMSDFVTGSSSGSADTV